MTALAPAPATEPRLAVIGTGRSGSGYIAAVLNAAGVRCGHESYWNPLGEQEEGLEADSSWCAVPHLSPIRWGIVHQVRHPLLTIASLTQTPDRGPYRYCRSLLMGYLPSDPLELAALTYLRWNEACEELTAFRYRVEDLDVDTLLGMAALADLSLADPEAALAETSSTTNDHGTSLTLEWDDLPDPLGGHVKSMAKRYGY